MKNMTQFLNRLRKIDIKRKMNKIKSKKCWRNNGILKNGEKIQNIKTNRFFTRDRRLKVKRFKRVFNVFKF